MTSPVSMVKGWCPGALRPMPSGDGLIIRVRPRLGLLSSAQFAVLAELSARFGDGDLHLTSRANVQIRGVSEAAYPAALDTLRNADLLDKDAQTEAIRNIMVTPQIALCSPNAGRDTPLAVARDLARAIEQTLLFDELYRRLPSKFGIAFQAGTDVDSDYTSDVTFLCEGRNRIFMILDGASGTATLCENAEQALQTLDRIAQSFIDLRARDGSIRRMRDAAPQVQARMAQPFAEGPLPVGPLEFAQDSRGFGIGFAFGEISQAAALEIETFMEAHSVAQLALTPQRALVFRCNAGHDPKFFQLAQKISGIADPRDILMRMHACVGTPACSRGTAPTRKDAKAVAYALREVKEMGSAAIHISGCDKRCARPRGAEITAVAKSGRYDIELGEGNIIHTGVSSADLPDYIAKRAT